MDWDQDGKLDVLSGCYWTDGEDGAHLQILKGRGQMDFLLAKAVKNIAGKPLQNVADDRAEQVDTNLICTEQHAVDVDSDGDLDLVVGCFGTKFFLYENLAEQHNGVNAIAEQAVVLPIESTSNHSAPHLVDWDNDGDLDLLSGTSQGGVIISENTGTPSEPSWSAFQQLIPPSVVGELTTFGVEMLAMGPATRIWATDWNGDGWQDLLIGDRIAVSSPAAGVDVDVWKRRLVEDNAQMDEIAARRETLMEEYQAASENGARSPDDLIESIKQLHEEMMEVTQRRSSYEESKSTGHVWLLIRKPS